MPPKDGIVIYAHKVILAARSEVFSTMFQTDPDGKFVVNGNNCKITDIQPDIFELVMKVIFIARIFYLCLNNI